MKKLIFGAALLLAVAAFAAAQSLSGVDSVNSPKPQLFRAGFYVGDETNALKTTTAKVTKMLSGSETVDFASATITCRDSTGSTVTGAKTGDPCFVGMPSTLTAGGTGLHESFTCYVSAADTVKIRACASGTADDPASVTFNTRIISSQ